jgi:hypothetical protein
MHEYNHHQGILGFINRAISEMHINIQHKLSEHLVIIASISEGVLSYLQVFAANISHYFVIKSSHAATANLLNISSKGHLKMLSKILVNITCPIHMTVKHI